MSGDYQPLDPLLREVVRQDLGPKLRRSADDRAAGVDYLIWAGVAAVQVDIGYKMWFGLLVAVWLIINEMISILENLSRMDVPLPDFLVKAIEKAKNSIDTKKKEDKHD